MRVIAGACKGRRLKTARGMALRPTSDKVRGAIFDILPTDLEEFQVLDLFAGTGALGIEALSRGAKNVIFADNRRAAISIIRKNLETCGLDGQAKVMQLKLPAGLKGLAKSVPKADLVFIDPPYAEGLPCADGLIEKTIAKLAGLNMVAPGGIVVAEHSSREKLKVTEFTQTRRKVYSTTAVTFFKRQ